MVFRKILKKIKKKFEVERFATNNVPVVEGHYLEGHTAFIYGASGGIGKAVARRFAENGCQVIIAGRDEKKLQNVVDELCVDKQSAQYVVLDIVKVSSFDGLMSDIQKKLEPNQKIDILVNCAGVHGKSDFWNVTPEEWDEVMDLNLKGMFFLAQMFGKYMRDNKIKGHILNIGSASALKPGKTPYEISKNGVRAMTLGMAQEMIPYGIIVNCLAPGPTATSMLGHEEGASVKWSVNPTGRMAFPEEIANWAMFMVSSLGDYVVGDSFYVSGGSGTICIDK